MDERQLTPYQALEILDKVTATITLNRENTFLVINALKTINQYLEKTKETEKIKEK